MFNFQKSYPGSIIALILRYPLYDFILEDELLLQVGDDGGQLKELLCLLLDYY